MRLIDGDALKRKMQKVATEAWKMKLTASIETTVNQFIDYINEAPTIEPKQGKWIDDGDTLICSNCKTAFNHPLFHGGWNYCPNCGYQMKGSEDGSC